MNVDSNIEQNVDETKKSQPLFTQEERKSFVKGFITAWDTHKTWLEFGDRPKSNDPLLEVYIESLSITKHPTEENLEARVKLRKMIDDNIKIASGSVHAPPEDVYKAINNLFNTITELQSNGFLGGTFVEYDVIERLDRLEQKVKEVSSLVDKHENRFIRDGI